MKTRKRAAKTSETDSEDTNNKDKNNSKKPKQKSSAKTEKQEKKKKTKSESKTTESNGSDSSMKRVVLRLENVVRARVVSRPSKLVKSPYMADILVRGDDSEQLCHSPALGCAGIITPGTQVIVTPKTSVKSDAKSKYSLDLVDVGPSVVGVNPMMCNKMVRRALEEGWVQSLPQFDKSETKSEVTVDESRFDFKCTKDNVEYYIEVKGVPCACIEDVPVTAKKREAMMETINKAENKIAYFPDGYRKSTEEVISPRALKHVEHLTRISETSDAESVVCVLLFLVQRQDCVVFQPTHNDPVYREEVWRASRAGVRILAHTVHWSEAGVATWADTLPLNLHDDQDTYQ